VSLKIHGEAELRRWLVDYLVMTFGCSPETVDPDLSLNELGVGSRDAVVLSGELSELLGRPVSPVEFWQHPTVNALAAFLTAPEQNGHAPDAATAGREPGASDAPIAVIGMGCRFPGDIDGPESMWKLLCEGRSAIGVVPSDRWEAFDDGSPEAAAALASTTKWGAFLTDVAGFDAEFFDISPGEATYMDPQQRLLLEVACEALEDAGIPAHAARGTQTGVFAGACVSEYGYLASRNLDQIDIWTGTGGALSIIANRLSYFLDLRGPSVAIDTACSSSLVAIHQACQSLRSGDSALAIAAGVNLLLSPAITRSFDRVGAMSPTGRCHAFDAGADGYVRGEGCGVVVLKRLADAQRDGNRVLAVVRGSALNQDGRSNGLMAPNPAAQIAVIRAACANAGIQPREVDYVEAHGTGTLLGDPIEARALGTVYGRGRTDGARLLIGSVKTNLGHLEAAAGVAGFIKTVLAVQHGQIPRTLNYQVPNPHIPFQESHLKVVDELHEWPSSGRVRRAGVSSFGFGGTNAHVVVEQAPEVVGVSAPQAPVSSVCTLVVSGKTPQRVAATAGVLAQWMSGAGSSVGLAEVAHTLNHHRTRHARFATVCATDREQAVAGLAALAAGVAGPGVVLPHEGPCGAGVVFVYSGQGSQWVGMGRQLLADEPAFAAAVAQLEPVFVAQTGFSLTEVLAQGRELVGIDRIQPVLVGVQIALTELWRAYGVSPDAVIGHSMGEVSAAVVAGALSPADGLAVITTRSQLMARLAGRGAMALLELDATATDDLIAGYPEVSVAVHASPRQTVIAGPPEQVDAVIAVVAGQDRLARRVEVDVASHHRTVDPILAELRAALADLAPQPPAIPMVSTVTGDHSPHCDADYWVANLRTPVRFAGAVAAAGADHATFVEISPHPLLTHAITETLGEAHHHAVGTLIRDTPDTVTFHTNLNTTHTTHPPTTEHPPPPPPPRAPPPPTPHPRAPHPPLDHHQRCDGPGGHAPAARHRCYGSHQRHAGVGKQARP
jgi:acyl transferase domain-containing protein/acyl carrier protein